MNETVMNYIADACERNGMLGFASILRGYRVTGFTPDGVLMDGVKNGEGVLHVSLRMEKDDD